MSKDLIQKRQFNIPKELSDAILQTIKTTLPKRTADRYEQDQVNQIEKQQNFPNQSQHLIFKEQPTAFNYNDDLMIRGSELLKYPQLYTHMGWTDTANSGILPEQYYRMGSNGMLDTTHFINFNNTDTYTPINSNYLSYVLNQAFKANGKYGEVAEKKRQGQITSSPKDRFAPTLTGFVPGADAMAANGNLEGATEVLAGQTSVLNTALGFTPAGFAAMSVPMFGSGYDRVKNAKDWKDYALGSTEMLMSAVPWLFKGYSGIRSAISPKYALSKAIDSTPLNVDMLNSYSEGVPQQRYLFSDWQSFGGAHPFDYQVGHIHDVDLSDIGTMLARHGYFNNPKTGKFILDAKLPSGKTINLNKVETQPINYPIQISANPELPQGYWGKRGDRDISERVISANNIEDVESTNKAKIVGYVGQDGKVHVTSSYPASDYVSKSFPVLFSDLNSGNPSYNIADKINKARQYWNNHAIVDEAIPARDPFTKGAKKSYIPYSFSKNPVATNKTTASSIWQSGKQQTIEYITGPTHKERLMNQLGLTEDQANVYIQQELRNLENVELLNLGQYKVGRPYGHTIGYTVDRQSGPHTFSRVKGNSDWMPKQWNEQKYRDFLEAYPQHAEAYDKAKQGITQVGIAEGDKPAKVNVGFHEGTHATTRGGMDSALSPIIEHDTRLAGSLLGQNPGMLDPMEVRTFGMELDRAWEALQNSLPEYYQKLSPSAQRKQFFYDILRASDDAGEKFYQSVPREWAERFDPKYNYILNSGANGLDPDEALYNFWDKFVYNVQPQFNNIYTT